MSGYELEQDSQAEWHQMMLERQEMVEEALYRLARGMGREKEINLLAGELKVPSPFQRKERA